jgi:hypothetical protein
MVLRDYLYDAVAADIGQDLDKSNGHRGAAAQVYPGWAYVPDTVILHQAEGLTPLARVVYAILAGHADKHNSSPPFPPASAWTPA